MTLEFNIEVFNPQKADLQKVVESVKDITADPKKITKDELALVKSTRIELRDYRTSIRKIGKAARDEANAYSKEVISYENELVDIIEPEETRLKEIEDDTKEYNLMKVRREKLPEMRARLDAIGYDSKLFVKDKELLKMDPNEFDAYYNARAAEKNEADRILLETKENEINAEKDKEKLKNEAQKQAESDLKKKLELQATEEKEEKARLEKEQAADIKYQEWLASWGCTRETEDNFYVTGDLTLYKKVAKYEK